MKKTTVLFFAAILCSTFMAGQDTENAAPVKQENVKPVAVAAESKKTPAQEEAARLRLLLESPNNTSSYLHALKYFSEIGDKTIVPGVLSRINELLEEIKKPEAPVEEEKPAKVAKKKGAKSAPAVRKPLRDSAKEQNIDTIEELIGILCEVKADTPEVKDMVYKLLGAVDDSRINRMALYALGELKFSGMFINLIYYMGEDQPTSATLKLRRELFWTMSKAGIKEAGPFMFRFLPDESPAVRANITLGFWLLKSRTYAFQLSDKAKYEQNPWVKEKMEWTAKQLSAQ